MRSFKSEIRSVATVGILSAGIVAAFPLASVGFRATPRPTERPASAAFVTLTEDEEELALRAAKTVWQADTSVQQMRFRLPLGDLPEEPHGPVFGFGSAGRRPDYLPQPMPYGLPPYRPSMAAAALKRLPPAPEPLPAPAFSRDDLLDLN